MSCAHVFSCHFWSRTAWFPWPWIRTMKWHCRRWNFLFSFPSESFCLHFQSIFPIIVFWQELTSSSPQVHWRRPVSGGLQTALSVCLLVTAPPCGHRRRVGLLQVLKSESLKANDVCFYKDTHVKLNVQEGLIYLEWIDQPYFSELLGCSLLHFGCCWFLPESSAMSPAPLLPKRK